jgi:plastocyanin
MDSRMGPLLRGLGFPLLLAVANVAAWADAPASLQVLDAEGTPVANGVIYLQGDSITRGAISRQRVVVDQRDKTFVPAVTVIQVGTEVTFPNNDTVSHHVYSFAQPNAFEVPLYKGSVNPTVRFEHAGIVTLGCNIHDSMLGYIVVVDTPFFAKTDRDGRVAWPTLRAGFYQVWMWSAELNAARGQQVGTLVVATQPAAETLRLATRLRSTAPRAAGSLSWSDY